MGISTLFPYCIVFHFFTKLLLVRYKHIVVSQFDIYKQILILFIK